MPRSATDTVATERDPLEVLGLAAGAGASEIRAARRELARRYHPDQGGDPVAMQAVNEAADLALARLENPPSVAPPSSAAPGDGTPGREPRWSGVVSDVPSFTVEALPVDTHHALLVVASWLGDVLDDDPPYRLDVHLADPWSCWCRLDVVPDAGASTVSITIAGVGGVPTPDITAVRDEWVAQLNQLDWADPTGSV
jgi:hypothetical protein